MFVIETVERDWNPISKYLGVPHTEADYERLVGLLNELIDEVGEDESHPLASLMEVIGTLIEKYEDEYVPELMAGSSAHRDITLAALRKRRKRLVQAFRMGMVGEGWE